MPNIWTEDRLQLSQRHLIGRLVPRSDDCFLSLYIFIETARNSRNDDRLPLSFLMMPSKTSRLS